MDEEIASIASLPQWPDRKGSTKAALPIPAGVLRPTKWPKLALPGALYISGSPWSHGTLPVA